MKKQDSLEWFLIKKFIEILILVGVIEYVITFLLNHFIFPPLRIYSILWEKVMTSAPFQIWIVPLSQTDSWEITETPLGNTDE